VKRTAPDASGQFTGEGWWGGRLRGENLFAREKFRDRERARIGIHYKDVATMQANDGSASAQHESNCRIKMD
jgi:hypothetical protein